VAAAKNSTARWQVFADICSQWVSTRLTRALQQKGRTVRPF